jgi:hypothetical protein
MAFAGFIGGIGSDGMVQATGAPAASSEGDWSAQVS